MEWQVVQNVHCCCPDGGDDLEPGGEAVNMLVKEGGDGVSIVGSMMLGLAHSINNNDAKAQSQLTSQGKSLERLQDSLDKCLGWVLLTRLTCQMPTSTVLLLKMMEIWSKLWTL